MGCDINAYTETLDTTTWTWTADQGDTFQPHGRPSMEAAYRKRDYDLFGLLAAGVRGRLFPSSWAQRGIPQNLSIPVERLYHYAGDRGFFPSYLFRDELMSKHSMLLLSNDATDLRLRELLGYLLRNLPPPPSNLKHQRLVFWFDD